MKITCVRMTEEAQTKRRKPEYYVMLSRGWKLRYGPWAKEPFERVFKNPFKGVEVPEVRMEELVRAMKAKGWDTLPEIDPEHIDLARLSRIEQEAKTDPTAGTRSRFLTVQVGNERKTVAYEVALRLGGAIHQAYIDCEIIALKGAMQHTVQVSVETMPLPLK